MNTQTNGGRDEAGRFMLGCPPGPGRPRRAVESDYLATLGDALTLEDWAAIVKRAVADAKNGSGTAREWVSKYALGANPMGLFDVARREALGVTSGDEIDAMNTEEATPRLLRNTFSDAPPFIKAAENKITKAEAEQERIEDERRRAKRAAKRAARRARMQQMQQAETSTISSE